jgi:glycosyltransferase involved in cell wall biosynthesis
MRIGILMALGSPWSREAVIRIAEWGLEVHAIAFSPRRHLNYLSMLDGYDENSINILKEHSVPVHLLKTDLTSGLKNIICGLELRNICKKHNVNLLLLLGGGGFALTAFLSFIRPYVLYTVGSDVLLNKGFRQIVNRITYRKAKLVIANGDFLGEKTKEFIGRRNVYPLYLGIDTNRFTPTSDPPKRMSILCNRSFGEIYNNEYLLDGLYELGETDLYDEVVFTAGGPKLSSAKAKTVTLGPDIIKKIQFLGGISDQEMFVRLHCASVYVSLSRSDGTSISLLEALACGLFPVLSDIPQNREWIDPKLQNGLLVPLDRPKELAEALKRALTDQGLRLHAAEINRQLILDRADAKKNMATLAFKLKNLTKSKI